MKKMFLFTLASLLIVSFSNCSKDSGSSSSNHSYTQSVSIKVDGVQKDFSKVMVIQEPWSDDGVPKVDLHVTATNPNDNTEYIQFGIGKGDVGEDQLWDFAYIKNDKRFPVGESGLYSAVSVNQDKKIVGVFNAGVSADGENHTLTDGVFNITYP